MLTMIPFEMRFGAAGANRCAIHFMQSIGLFTKEFTQVSNPNYIDGGGWIENTTRDFVFVIDNSATGIVCNVCKLFTGPLELLDHYDTEQWWCWSSPQGVAHEESWTLTLTDLLVGPELLHWCQHFLSLCA